MQTEDRIDSAVTEHAVHIIGALQIGSGEVLVARIKVLAFFDLETERSDDISGEANFFVLDRIAGRCDETDCVAFDKPARFENAFLRPPRCRSDRRHRSWRRQARIVWRVFDSWDEEHSLAECGCNSRD